MRDLITIAVVFSYIFASGRIADFMRSSGRAISRREVLLAPAAYMLFCISGVLLYFSSGAWVPPQNSLISNLFYIVAAPLAIAIGLGALSIHSFFRDRLSLLQSLDLSMRIVLAPLFDGIKGYWTALSSAAILVGISTFTYWSSGGNLSLVTFDFLLLSIVASLYFAYRAIVSVGSEGKASNTVTALTIMAPSVLRAFFKEAACALLSLVPFQLFQSCPLDAAGSEVSLAISVLATLVLLVPAIPFIYAVMVNLLRFVATIEALSGRGSVGQGRGLAEEEGGRRRGK
jgi:hypothetical protein